MIEKGVITQKPKWHFMLLTLLCVFGASALFLILLYLVSFMSLVLREHLIIEALSFGPRTVVDILHMFPFLLIVLVATVLLILHVLVRHFAFAYTKPVLVTFGGGLLLTLVLFGMVLIFDANSRIARFGEGRHIPGVDVLHSHFREREPARALRGTLLRYEDGKYAVTTRDGKEVSFTVDEKTRQDGEYVVGDQVMILLISTPTGLRAIALTKDNGKLPPPRP